MELPMELYSFISIDSPGTVSIQPKLLATDDLGNERALSRPVN
jgi:hypothetical protein